MAQPTYQQWLYPVLELHQAQGALPIKQSIVLLKELNPFGMSAEEFTQYLDSNNCLIYKDRIGWARYYLLRAGLLERTEQRATYRITQEGEKFLKTWSRQDVTTKELIEKYPKLKEFVSGAKPASKFTGREDKHEIEEEVISQKTPQELLQASYKALHKNLAEELLEKIQEQSWEFFEDLVVDLIVKMGYGGSFEQVTSALSNGREKRTGDGGIDGIISEDRLGLDKIYLQAKKWQKGSSVGSNEIRTFIGALVSKGAQKGVFVTTAQFSKEAIKLADSTLSLSYKIVLIDGLQLVDLMIEYNLGTAVEQTYHIKRIDNDYFDRE